MLGDKIKTLRISQGLTQNDFAKKLFVTPAAVSQWEKGKTIPDTERLMSICRAFSIPLSYFSDDTEMTEGELITQQLLSRLNGLPKTEEAIIISGGIDKMPKEEREKAVNVMKVVFSKYADYFKEEEDDT